MKAADLIERIDKIHELGYMNWTTCGWAMMFIKQGIISATDAPRGGPRRSGISGSSRLETG